MKYYTKYITYNENMTDIIQYMKQIGVENLHLVRIYTDIAYYGEITHVQENYISKTFYHREGNPAIIEEVYENGMLYSLSQEWYIDGLSHRIDVPAKSYVKYKNIYDGVIPYANSHSWFYGGKYCGEVEYKTWPLTPEQQIEFKLKYAK